MQRLDLGGGARRSLAEAPGGRGGTWSADGVILFASNSGGPLSRVAAAGGSVVPVPTLDRHTSHRFPTFLPDGRHFLFYAQGGPDTSGIFLGALDAKTQTRLTAADTAGTYLPGAPGRADSGGDGGFVPWVRGSMLVAQRLDLAETALTGDPVPLADPVRTDAGLMHSAVSVSATGLVAYRSGESRRQLTWRDRTGKVLGTRGPRMRMVYLLPMWPRTAAA